MKRSLFCKFTGAISRNTVPSLCALGVVSLAVTSTVVQSQEQTTVSADPKAPELAVAVVRATGEEVFYDVINGMAVLENDIILGTHAEVQAYGIEPLEVGPGDDGDAVCSTAENCSLITTDTRRKWTDGIVPYTIQEGSSNAAIRTIADAIDDWETKTPIRFVERSNERDYIEFEGVGGSICSSRLGRSGGRQAVRFVAGGNCLIHEIGHAMGLSHEQNRNDRDQFVTIDFSNVAGNFASQYRIASSSTDVGEYDFRSVMHYRAFQFGIDRSRPTIIPIDPNIPLSEVGGVSRLSPGDVEGIEFVYGDTPSVREPEPPADRDPAVAFVGLTDGGTIPAFTSYGDIQVIANDLDAGRSNGAGIRSVTLSVSRDGRTLGSRQESRAPYDFGFRLTRGRTYTLTATARANPDQGGTSTSTSVTVTAR